MRTTYVVKAVFLRQPEFPLFEKLDGGKRSVRCLACNYRMNHVWMRPVGRYPVTFKVRTDEYEIVRHECRREAERLGRTCFPVEVSVRVVEHYPGAFMAPAVPYRKDYGFGKSYGSPCSVDACVVQDVILETPRSAGEAGLLLHGFRQGIHLCPDHDFERAGIPELADPWKGGIVDYGGGKILVAVVGGIYQSAEQFVLLFRMDRPFSLLASCNDEDDGQ